MEPTTLPEESEFVLATIKKIMPYGALCILPEYKNAEAFCHVSEVASRWIKNIHEFISENDKIVVKVLRVDREKRQIDVSIRRVNEEEKRNKLESVKRAARAEKLLQFALSKSKCQLNLNEIVSKLEDVYGEAYSALENALENDDAFAKIQIPNTLKKEIIDVVRKSIKKAKIFVSAKFNLKCFGANGVNSIKKALTIDKSDANDVHILYMGAPNYKIVVSASEYKDANKKLEKILEKISSSLDKDCIFEYRLEK